MYKTISLNLPVFNDPLLLLHNLCILTIWLISSFEYFLFSISFSFLLLESDIKVGYISEPLTVWRDRPEISSKVRESKLMQIKILNEFLMKNPKFILNNILLVIRKFVKSYGGLILGRTLLKSN